MASIFISYRREDSGGHAGRLCDRLSARFGGDRVFMDIQDIRPGQNFATSIEETIATCDCVIAVIGPRWLETVRARLQSGDDFVRHEIEAALRRRVLVIPVLVGGARMPPAADLPSALAEVSLLNAVEIRDERFDDDVEALETFLANTLHARRSPAVRRGAQGTRHLRWAIPVVVVVLAVGGYQMFRSSTPVAGDPPVADTPGIDGDWVAVMQRPGQPSFRIHLTFQSLGESTTGVVRYPTGDGAMHDVVRKGRTLTFYTTHVPQFESTPVTIRFQGDIGADRIQLMATYDAGVATGVASREATR
jgi:hypothetical protein